MKKLHHPIIGVKEFEDGHAERILVRKRTGGWTEIKEEEQNGVDDSTDKGNTEKANKGKASNSKGKASGK